MAGLKPDDVTLVNTPPPDMTVALLAKGTVIPAHPLALDAERQRGLSSAEAIFEACQARFRPILMTTMAALFAGIPLVIATGPGTELRRPLGITIIGGLFVVEAMSVIIQVFFYKRTGKRVFRMAPIHHHFEQLGWSEPTVVIRFWIIAFVLALAGLSTLKLR